MKKIVRSFAAGAAFSVAMGCSPPSSPEASPSTNVPTTTISEDNCITQLLTAVEDGLGQYSTEDVQNPQAVLDTVRRIGFAVCEPTSTAINAHLVPGECVESSKDLGHIAVPVEVRVESSAGFVSQLSGTTFKATGSPQAVCRPS